MSDRRRRLDAASAQCKGPPFGRFLALQESCAGLDRVTVRSDVTKPEPGAPEALLDPIRFGRAPVEPNARETRACDLAAHAKAPADKPMRERLRC